MTYNKLNFRIRQIMAGVAITGFLAACNDTTETANSSTGNDSLTNATNTIAQTETAAPPVKKKGKATIDLKADDETVKIEKDKTGYYNRTDIAPAYPGGQTSLEQYINDNIQYPQEAIDNNIEGTVYVKFGVDENGNITNVSTVGNKVGYGLEEEAVKVVSKMNQWRPGQVKDKNVKTWRTLPIIYKLES